MKAVFTKILTPYQEHTANYANKSGLQIHESVAFVQLLASVFDDMFVVTTQEIAIKEQLLLARPLNWLSVNPAAIQQASEYNFTKDDCLFVLCGPINIEMSDEQQQWLLAQYVLMESFPGDVFYIINDLRLPLYKNIGTRTGILFELTRQVHLVTQAANLVATHSYMTSNQPEHTMPNYNKISHINLELLVMITKNIGSIDDLQVPSNTTKLDVCYPSMHVYTMTEYRLNRVVHFLKYQKTAMMIGPWDPSEQQQAMLEHEYGSHNLVSATGTIAYHKVETIAKEFMSQIMINESSYNYCELTPNRIIESLIYGNLLFFDSDSFSELIKNDMRFKTIQERIPETIVSSPEEMFVIINDLRHHEAKLHRLVNEQRYIFGLSDIHNLTNLLMSQLTSLIKHRKEL